MSPQSITPDYLTVSPEPRIALRLPTPRDAAVLHRYASDEGSLEGAWVPLASGASRSACEGLIDDWLAGWRNLPSRQGPALVVVEADYPDLIGQVGLGNRGDGVVELVYGIGRHKALLYQFAGTSSSGLGPVGSPDNWRCVFLTNLSDVEVRDGPWYTCQRHSERSTCIDAIDLEVSY